MAGFLIWVAILFIGVVLAAKFLKNKHSDGNTSNERTVLSKYRYEKKRFFMSRPEHECYNALMAAVGKDYYVFPQVHLSVVLNHKIKGQNWYGALRHIDEKSIDFVLCDKNYIEPRLAIELDDRTHEREDRKERDGEVERILSCAELPLLRLENHGQFNSSELSLKIKTALERNSEN